MNKVLDGYVYIKTKKGMYGLKQATILAYEKNAWIKAYSPHYGPLEARYQTNNLLPPYIYDFGIKYFNKPDAIHLLQSLQNIHTITIDWL